MASCLRGGGGRGSPSSTNATLAKNAPPAIERHVFFAPAAYCEYMAQLQFDGAGARRRTIALVQNSALASFPVDAYGGAERAVEVLAWELHRLGVPFFVVIPRRPAGARCVRACVRACVSAWVRCCSVLWFLRCNNFDGACVRA